ncbi:calcofluor white hypersensitive protein-like protein [Pseudovirgaria hyperparasitica]|uniref:Calcofluor white hypersensitive protein-like protein n=1 Tax=Pseudovirgaria hyperparasitica TaxID=470096 RepID=A0A6A6WFK9_9PEZI|nr:calcofluor white hypersensitive protein-like protein [Pseudovirgaria hyperparasitica]KAF2760790.1 calcofluor white hypersensitive protein-like protein [Pseudovirgaria hyperparasitica]
MAPKFKEGDVIASFSGKWIGWAHTIMAYTAFFGALIVGIKLHYHKIVQNEHYGYPQEWFPSVSATIGDRYPERSVFQLFIALTSGPRFALCAMWYFMTQKPGSSLPRFVFWTGIFRTMTCGGWTYVTSTDDHDWHDIFMISYLVATLPWTIGCILLSPQNPTTIKYRKIFGYSFFGTLVPLIYFFIQHKVHKVAGAYTIYAFFEWALVLLDVAFDAVTIIDFDGLEIVVKDIKGLGRGKGKYVADAVLEKEKNKDVGVVFGQAFSWPAAIDAAADVYNGYVYWTTLTSLGVCVWYFPLWYMGISGYEVLVMTTISPFLLSVPPLRRLIVKNLRVTHLLGLAGLVAFLTPKPTHRLFTVGFGVWMSTLAWAATFYGERSQPHRLEARVSAFSLGLLASSVAKFAFYTNNPLWPIMHAENGGWNKFGLFVAVLAVLRSTGRPAGSDVSAPGPKSGSSVLSAFGLAGLFFAMHSLLSDSSTMILWVWEGFPVQGPIAVPHGSYTLFAMGVGIVVGLFYPDLSRSWTFYGIGSVGAAVLTTYSNWLGFYGALVLAAYTMALAPALISSAVKHSPATTFGLGFLVYNFMVLFHVWVVAYAFVPGGPLVRERTDWVMTTMMLLIGCGVFSANASGNSVSLKSRSKAPNPATRKQRSYYLYVLLALELLSVSIAYLRFPTYDYTPYHKDEKLVTAGIWTIHFSLDNDMWSSEYRMRDVIKELELDVVGLLESDLQRIIMGNRDTTQFLAEDLGMYVDFGPGPNKHTWGSALLSKFPIVNSTHHLLPSPVGELAPAIHATLDMYGEMIDVFVFHSGQEEDPEDRRLQSEYLAKLMRETPRPAILLSYLVTKPHEGNYNTYVGEKSSMRDIDPSDVGDRWCEYILYKGFKRTGYARVSRDTITDTEIQVGKFQVGQPEGSDTIIPEEQVPYGMRFPTMFRGAGVRGHRYHVFDEPRYFA